jgi:hypothetical protein
MKIKRAKRAIMQKQENERDRRSWAEMQIKLDMSFIKTKR